MADMLQYSSFDSSGSDSDPDTPVMEEQLKRDDSTGGGAGIIKQQAMFIWNTEYEKWHECDIQFKPPHLHIQEYEDTMMEIKEKQLQHLHKRWFQGNISRREAKYIIQDYSGGDGSFLVRTSESYSGKFAISFMHEGRVKHVVIETKPDPITGVVYHITPNGPYFDSLSGLIEEARNTCIIKNHMFKVVLTKSPPKPDQRWLHSKIKTLSQAEQLMRKEQLDGSFFVYQTSSDYAPYSLLYRSGGNIVHASIMTSQRPSHGYTLNGVSAPVLYKLIHYYMENPIHGDTVLQYPVEDKDPSMSNCAVASEDYTGDCSKNELCFNYGALITNISRRSVEWCVGDHRGDRQKFFPTNSVWFLSKEELDYINDVKASLLESRCSNNKPNVVSHSLNLKSDYTVRFYNDTNTVIHILPANPLISTFRHFKISCPTCHDVEQWYQTLEKNNCLCKESDGQSSPNCSTGKRNGRKKRGSCIIS